MNYNELIERLEEWNEVCISEMCADDKLTCDDLCGNGDCIVVQAGKAIKRLMAELSEECHRHDRLQDFEVAQAQELARVKEERDAAFSGNTTPQPVPQEDPEWKQRVLRTFLGGR